MSKSHKQSVLMMVVAQVIMYLGPLIVPTWANVTEMGVKMLCVYIGVLLMFMFTGDILSGSLLGILATIIHGYYSLNDMFNFVFGSPVAVQMVAMLTFCTAVRNTGALDVLGRKIVRATSRFKKKPFLFCIIFMLGMYVCLWYITGLAAVITIIPIFEQIAKTVGYKPEDKWHKIMILILFLLLGAGAYTRGTDGMQLGWIGLFQSAVGFNYVYKPLELMVPTRLTLAVCVVIWVVLAKVLGANMTKLANVDFDSIEELKKENTKFSKVQIISLALFFVVLFKSLLSNPFVEGTFAYKMFGIFDMKMCAFIAMVIATYIHIDEKPLMDIPKAFAMLPWGIFLVLGTMMVVAGALSSPNLGIRTWIADSLAPLFGTNNYFLFCFMVLLFTGGITNLMSNQATIMIMLSVAATFIDKFANQGINVTPLVGAVCVMGNFAFMLYCSGPNSPYYLNRPEIDNKFTFGIGSIYLLVSIVVLAAGATVFGYIM